MINIERYAAHITGSKASSRIAKAGFALTAAGTLLLAGCGPKSLEPLTYTFKGKDGKPHTVSTDGCAIWGALAPDKFTKCEPTYGADGEINGAKMGNGMVVAASEGGELAKTAIGAGQDAAMAGGVIAQFGYNTAIKQAAKAGASQTSNQFVSTEQFVASQTNLTTETLIGKAVNTGVNVAPSSTANVAAPSPGF